MCNAFNIIDDNSTVLNKKVVNLQTSISRPGKVHSELQSDGGASAKRTNTASLNIYQLAGACGTLFFATQRMFYFSDIHLTKDL